MYNLKIQFLLLLILIGLSPQAFAVQGNCIEEARAYCFDPNLEISVGNKFRWVLDQHLENDFPVDYGSNNPLVLEIEVINDFKDMSTIEVYSNWTQYFKMDLSIDGAYVNETKNNLTLNEFNYRLIEPTIDAYTIKAPNRYVAFIELFPDGYTELQDASWTDNSTELGFYTENITINHHIIDNVYYANISSYRIDNSDSEILIQRKFERGVNINTRIVIFKANSLKNYLTNESISFIINKAVLNDPELKLFEFGINSSLITGLVIITVIGISILIIYYRKTKN